MFNKHSEQDCLLSRSNDEQRLQHSSVNRNKSARRSFRSYVKRRPRQNNWF